MPEPSLAPSLRDLEATPANHFALVFGAMVFRFLADLSDADLEDEQAVDPRQAAPSLARYFQGVAPHVPESMTWGEGTVWWDTQVELWTASTDAHLPLKDLGTRSGLGLEAGIVAVLTGAVEEDLHLGADIASLQHTPGSRRPTVSLLASITRSNHPDVESVPADMLRQGWLVALGNGEILAERHVRLPLGLWPVLRGRTPRLPGAKVRAEHELPQIGDLPEAIASTAGALPDLIRHEQPRALVIRGPAGSGRMDIALATAAGIGHGAVALEWPRSLAGAESGAPPEGWDELGPFCALARVMPVVSVEAGPGEAIRIPALRAYTGPVAITLGRQGGLAGDVIERALYVDVPFPDRGQRTAAWAEALEGIESPAPEELASRYHLSGGYVRRIALQARALTALDDRDAITLDDVRRASTALNRHHLEPLAQRLEPWGTWDDLFVGKVTAEDLLELELRCHRREALVDVAGPALRGSLTRGVRALFNGPTGTGKTLAARVLSAELGMDLYRVDLAAVIDKYVGETEKRLDRLLSRAEELDVILLLDEGDSLLTGRTDVRSANDRYANLETNYLLQRLEAYEGIFLVTTNAGSRIDQAFQRRFDAVVDFPPPSARERQGIWSTHLPEGHRLDPAQMKMLASRATLTGGQIRNAALFATLLASSDGRDGAVRLDDLERALRREYRKAGAAYPGLEGSGATGGREAIRKVEELLETLR